MLVKLGITLFFLSFLCFFISDFYLKIKSIIFFSFWGIGVTLILIHIFQTGNVPLRGRNPWPNFKKNLLSSILGLIIYLALFIIMIRGLILSLLK